MVHLVVTTRDVESSYYPIMGIENVIPEDDKLIYNVQWMGCSKSWEYANCVQAYSMATNYWIRMSLASDSIDRKMTLNLTAYINRTKIEICDVGSDDESSGTTLDIDIDFTNFDQVKEILDVDSCGRCIVYKVLLTDDTEKMIPMGTGILLIKQLKFWNDYEFVKRKSTMYGMISSIDEVISSLKKESENLKEEPKEEKKNMQYVDKLTMDEMNILVRFFKKDSYDIPYKLMIGDFSSVLDPVKLAKHAILKNPYVIEKFLNIGILVPEPSPSELDHLNNYINNKEITESDKYQQDEVLKKYFQLLRINSDMKDEDKMKDFHNLLYGNKKCKFQFSAIKSEHADLDYVNISNNMLELEKDDDQMILYKLIDRASYCPEMAFERKYNCFHLELPQIAKFIISASGFRKRSARCNKSKKGSILDLEMDEDLEHVFAQGSQLKIILSTVLVQSTSEQRHQLLQLITTFFLKHLYISNEDMEKIKPVIETNKNVHFEVRPQTEQEFDLFQSFDYRSKSLLKLAKYLYETAETYAQNGYEDDYMIELLQILSHYIILNRQQIHIYNEKWIQQQQKEMNTRSKRFGRNTLRDSFIAEENVLSSGFMLVQRLNAHLLKSHEHISYEIRKLRIKSLIPQPNSRLSPKQFFDCFPINMFSKLYQISEWEQKYISSESLVKRVRACANETVCSMQSSPASITPTEPNFVENELESEPIAESLNYPTDDNKEADNDDASSIDDALYIDISEIESLEENDNQSQRQTIEESEKDSTNNEVLKQMTAATPTEVSKVSSNNNPRSALTVPDRHASTIGQPGVFYIPPKIAAHPTNICASSYHQENITTSRFNQIPISGVAQVQASSVGSSLPSPVPNMIASQASGHRVPDVQSTNIRFPVSCGVRSEVIDLPTSPVAWIPVCSDVRLHIFNIIKSLNQEKTVFRLYVYGEVCTYGFNIDFLLPIDYSLSLTPELIEEAVFDILNRNYVKAYYVGTKLKAEGQLKITEESGILVLTMKISEYESSELENFWDELLFITCDIESKNLKLEELPNIKAGYENAVNTFQEKMSELYYYIKAEPNSTPASPVNNGVRDKVQNSYIRAAFLENIQNSHSSILHSLIRQNDLSKNTPGHIQKLSTALFIADFHKTFKAFLAHLNCSVQSSETNTETEIIKKTITGCSEFFKILRETPKIRRHDFRNVDSLAKGENTIIRAEYFYNVYLIELLRLLETHMLFIHNSSSNFEDDDETKLTVPVVAFDLFNQVFKASHSKRDSSIYPSSKLKFIFERCLKNLVKFINFAFLMKIDSVRMMDYNILDENYNSEDDDNADLPEKGSNKNKKSTNKLPLPFELRLNLFRLFATWEHVKVLMRVETNSETSKIPRNILIQLYEQAYPKVCHVKQRLHELYEIDGTKFFQRMIPVTEIMPKNICKLSLGYAATELFPNVNSEKETNNPWVDIDFDLQLYYLWKEIIAIHNTPQTTKNPTPAKTEEDLFYGFHIFLNSVSYDVYDFNEYLKNLTVRIEFIYKVLTKDVAHTLHSSETQKIFRSNGYMMWTDYTKCFDDNSLKIEKIEYS